MSFFRFSATIATAGREIGTQSSCINSTLRNCNISLNTESKLKTLEANNNENFGKSKTKIYYISLVSKRFNVICKYKKCCMKYIHQDPQRCSSNDFKALDAYCQILIFYFKNLTHLSLFDSRAFSLVYWLWFSQPKTLLLMTKLSR